MAVYGYVRVSTVTQARERESLEAQRRQVMSYAASKGKSDVARGNCYKTRARASLEPLQNTLEKTQTVTDYDTATVRIN